MSDNVTPFRPRRPAPKVPKSPNFGIATHRGRAVMVQALTLAAFTLGFVFPTPPLSYLVLAVAIGAVMIAASNRQGAMPWAATHHEHALRTLVIGYTITIVASLIALLMPGRLTPPVVLLAVAQIQFWTSVVVLVWAVVRAGVGLVLAIMRKPIWRPKGLLL